MGEWICLANPSFSRIFGFLITWQDPLPLSSSSTASREFLSQFSTCSGWRWLEMGGKILVLLKEFHENFSDTTACRKLSHSSVMQNDVFMQREGLNSWSWSTFYDTGPTLKHHWINVSFLPPDPAASQTANWTTFSQHWLNVSWLRPYIMTLSPTIT